MASDGLKLLDKGSFGVAWVIPQRKIIGSTLTPDSDYPTRGSARVWQADLHVVGAGQKPTCWTLRIIGSENRSQIDLVAQESPRDYFNFGDGA